MLLFYFIGLSAILFVCHVEANNKGITINIESMTVETDKAFLAMDAKLRQENGANVVDMAIDLHQEIVDPIYIESEILTRAEGATDYVSFLKGTKVDLCEFFENPKLNPLLTMVMDALNKYGNQFQTCPITKAKFSITGFRMDPTAIPSFVPGGDYRIAVRTTRLVGGDFKQLWSYVCDTRIKKIE